MVRKYWAIIKATWQENLTYRLNFFLEIIGGFLTQLVIMAIWFTIFRELGKEQIGSYTLKDMISYLLGAGIINSFIILSSQGDEINDDINRGDLANLLIKPLNVPLYWFTRDACRRLLTLFLGFLGYVILFLFFSKYLVFPQSFFLFGLTLFFIILAGLLHFFLFYVFSIIAFWLDETWGPRLVIRVIMTIATGALIPLSLFPPHWQTVFNLLPFKFFVYTPMAIYLGKINSGQILHEFMIAALWLIFLAVTSFWLWKKGLKNYSAYGH